MDAVEKSLVEAAKSILATTVTPTLSIELPKFGNQNERTTIHVLDALVALRRATRSEGSASGMYRYSDFWFGEGPRPSQEEVMLEWLSGTARRTSCCDAHTENHSVCGLKQAAAIVRVVSEAANLPEADDAVRWQTVKSAMLDLSKTMPY